MELQGSKTKAWLSFNTFLPKSPLILLKGVLAIIASSATTKELVLLIILMIFEFLGLPGADLGNGKDIIGKDYTSKL